MRIVVIGATGNVGSAVLRELAAEPSVTGITGVARRLPSRSAAKVDWQVADILTADLQPIFADADVVIHLAWAIQPARDRALTRAIDVDGSTRVFRAAAQAGVGRLVHASSVGVYSPGPHDRRVDEQWPGEGISSSFYSRDKADAEHALDVVEREFPELGVVRLRPGIVMQRGAAEEIRRFFLGPFVPSRLLRPELIAVMPDVAGVVFQAVHARRSGPRLPAGRIAPRRPPPLQRRRRTPTGHTRDRPAPARDPGPGAGRSRATSCAKLT